MTIKEFLAEQERLAEAATPGPWETDDNQPFSRDLQGIFATDERRYVLKVEFDEQPENPSDAEFIAAARSSVPRMLMALKAVMRVADMWEKAAAVHGPDDTVFLIDSYNAHIETIRGAIEAALGGEGDE